MSSARSVPLAAFVEEYDEDANIIVPDTRRIANLSARRDLRRQSSQLSVVANDGLSTGATGGSSPVEDQTPLNLPSWYFNSAGGLFEGHDRLWPSSPSSSTGGTVATRYSRHTASASSSRTSPRSRSPSSGDESSATLIKPAVPSRQRLRRQTSSSTKSRPYHAPSYRPFQPYVQPEYNPYYPANNFAPYAIQGPHPPVLPFSSAYGSTHCYSHTGTEYPSHGTGMSTSAGGAPHPSGQLSEGVEAPRPDQRCSKRPVHRFINLRRLQTDRDGEDPGNNLKTWRAFTREFPLDLPGKPQLELERYNIIRSRLISGVGSERDNAAVLTYEEAEDGGERLLETQWMHYTSDTMELESFMTEILRLKEVPENAFPIIIELFKDLRQVYEKPFVHGRYLEPTVRRFAAGDNDGGDGETKCSVELVFIAFPYLSLEPLRSLPTGGRETVHPVRSLLQFHYSFVSTLSRDGNQVACHARNPPDALYVPQVWMLLINDDIIVSTGPVDIQTLRGNYVHLEKAEPPTSAPAQRQIRVTGIQGKQYCFPQAQCKTWFDFVKALLSALEPNSSMAAVFLEDSWMNTVELLVGDEAVSEVNWVDTIHKHQHQHGDITIRLVQKQLSPKPQHIPSARAGTQDRTLSFDNQLILSHESHPASRRAYHDMSSATQPLTSSYCSNMYPVVAIKMQFTAEHWHAFITDNYVLDSPDGPITSVDWDEKVYPGMSVTIRLKSEAPGGKLVESMSQQTQTGQSITDPNEPERDIPPVLSNGVATDAQTAAGDDTRSMLIADEPSDGHISLSEPPHENDTAGAYADVNVFDYLICEKDDDEYLLREGFPGVTNPFRYQVRNDAWKTKEDLVTDLATLSSSPSSSLFPFSTSDSLSLPSSPWPSHTDSSATSPQSELLSGGTTSSAREVLPIPTSASKVRPFFDWTIEARRNPHSLGHSVDEGSTGGKRDEQSDSNVCALLEGCDKEAFYILTSHPAQRLVMRKISKCTLMQVQAEIERTKISLLPQPDDLDNRATEREAWARKEKVIQAALHLLGAFVPLHYQKLDGSWLIGIFFGAIYTIVRGNYAGSYLIHIESILSHLGKTVDRIHAGVAYDSKERQTAPVLPSSLVHAFPPLIFLVCICSQLLEIQCQGWQDLQLWAERLYDGLTHGKHELISMARTGQYSETKVFTRVDAEDVIALVIKRLAELPRAKVPWQQNHKDGFNLLETYRNHISQMEFRARRTPSSDLFDEIQQLMEEIQILHVVLDQQLTILESTLEVMSSSDGPSAKISSSCISQSQQNLQQMRHDLLQLERMAEKAAVGLRYMLEVRKESNSKAITIFTIVTVIFLPLSFVTSYLGMNSVDIRGGNFTQALFWAIAIPITAFLVGSLWVALRFRRRIRRFVIDKLGSFGRWCMGIVKGLALSGFRSSFRFGFGGVSRRVPLPEDWQQARDLGFCREANNT
ncbi:hypothetical protein BDW75DRAFT_237809 [Aspergillus navahoensis]